METKYDFSYGVIALHQSDSATEVLLVHQRSHRGEQFWTFPKGHMESGETKEQTALRELAEETGVAEISLIEGAVFSTEYIFVHESEKICKRVEFFLGYVTDPKTVITQPDEVVDLVWCDFAKAKSCLTHQNMRHILSEVESFLNN